MTELLVSGVSAAEHAVPGGHSARTVGELARLQARRMVRHPVVLVGLAWVVVAMGFGSPGTPYEEYSGVTGLVAFFIGPLAFFAANLVASSERRSGADDWTGALSMPERDRTLALLVAALAPAGLAAVLNLVLYAVVAVDGVVMPIAWTHVASVPLTVLGGAVLGVAVARLLPWPGMALLVMVGLVSFNVWVSTVEDYLGFYVDFAQWEGGDEVPLMEPGNGSLHLVYLGSLVALAACGALLRDVRRPVIPFVLGGGFGALVLVAGTLQLST
jgi:hypothetical protein